MSLRTYVRTHRFAIALVLIAVTGLVLRVFYTLHLQHRLVGGDGFRFHNGAVLLVDGHGFVNPLSVALGQRNAPPDTGHPPGWTLVLAFVTKLGLRTWLAHQLVTGVVGTATIVMVGIAARQAFNNRIGLMAAGLTAIYPNVFLYEREVLSEPLAMLGIATMIWLTYAFIARRGWAWPSRSAPSSARSR